MRKINHLVSGGEIQTNNLLNRSLILGIGTKC